MEKRLVHQEWLVADEAIPEVGISLWIGTEVEAAEHRHQIVPCWQFITCGLLGLMTAQQLEAGVPIVVPAAFPLQGIDAAGVWSPAAVMLHGRLQRPSVTAGYIPDHTIDIEQEHTAGWRCWALQGLMVQSGW